MLLLRKDEAPGAKPSTPRTDNEVQTVVINNYLLLHLLVAASPQPE